MYFEEAKKYGSFYEQLLADNPVRLTRNVFTEPLTYDNIGILYSVNGKWTENGSTVYYFAGNALNNWVKFGGYYWRIIRTNEDGGIRMLYSGINPNTESAYINVNKYNATLSGLESVGYMYSLGDNIESNRMNEIDSNVKVVIDNWYKNGLNSKYDELGNLFDKYVSKTAIYCNDRSGLSKGSSEYYFSSTNRSVYGEYPSYKCGNAPNGTLYEDASVADKFSVSKSSGGNGQLTYPMALMTIDELTYAGSRYFVSAKTWTYFNSENKSITGDSTWWTMSPYHFSGNEVADPKATLSVVLGNGSKPGDIHNSYAILDIAIRPVISLKSCVNYVSGNGSSSNPYEVSISSACASAEN